MRDLSPEEQRDFFAALDLWATVEPYSGFPAATVGWRLVPAFENVKYRAFWQDGRFLGFATWAFMTHEEFESRDYCGSEVFSRPDGDLLVVVELVVPGGPNDVLWACRQLRRFFKAEYPGHPRVLAHRGSRNGVFPNMGG